MKRIIVSLMCLAVIGITGYALAQGANNEVAIRDNNVNVTLTYQPTPEFSVSGYSQKGTSTKNRWLQVECSFITEPSANARFFDDITVKYDVFMSSALDNRKQPAIALFSGEERYSYVMRDGQTHKVVAFLAPAHINAYKGPALKLRKGDEDFSVLVTISANGRAIGVGAWASKNDAKTFNITKSNVKQEMVRIIKAMDTETRAIKLTNSVRRRGTPYEFINFDSYEYLTPVGAEAAAAPAAAN